MNHYTSMDQIKRAIDNDEFRRAYRARLKLALDSGKEIMKEHRHKLAQICLSSGFNLIPSEHLNDTQMVVSQAVYEEAKKIVGGESG